MYQRPAGLLRGRVSNGWMLHPRLEALEERRLITAAAPNGYLLAFSAALKVSTDGIDLGGIYVMRPDGTGLRQITTFQTVSYSFEPHGLNLPDDHPTFSPDGTKIVFTSNRANPGFISGIVDNTEFDIYVMDVNGSNITRLTTTPGLDTEPVFSPDGSKIAFTSARAGNLNIFVMNSDGSNLHQLTTSPLEDIEPSWSPDGTKIAFARVQSDTEKDVFIMNADGSNQHQITFAPGQDHDPTWSPDGQALVITSERDGSPPFGDVFKIRASDGASLGDLTSDLALGGGDPAWSPDGTQVAFMKDDFPLVVPPVRLWIMNADGSNKHEFASQGLLNVHPNWGIAADSDHDGRLDYLENSNTSFVQEATGHLSQTGDQFGAAIALPDLTLDGQPDVAIGDPGETVNGLGGAGLVLLGQGTPQGPFFPSAIGPGPFLFPQINAENAGSTVRQGGHFGQTMVAGDFFGIARKSLAIGAPGQNQVFVAPTSAGPWTILNGPGGFGSSLAVGDFNHDGKADLAVGSPLDDLALSFPLPGVPLPAARPQAGSVRIYYGSSTGLSTTPQIVSQDDLPLAPGANKAAPGDEFGFALAAGDVTGDGADDLIVGSPGEDVNGVTNSGLIQVIPGLIGGRLQPTLAFARDARSLPAPYTGLQANAQFGEVLAAGNFDQDLAGADDLVVGIPHEDILSSTFAGTVSVPDAGLVAVYPGRLGILVTSTLASTAQVFNQLNVSGPGPVPTLGSTRFGQTLAVGDFTGDALQDLAVAAPFQRVASSDGAGVVFIIPGSPPTTSSVNTGFGASIGPINSLFGAGGGLATGAAQRVDLGQLGGGTNTGDHFGASLLLPSANALAAGDIDGDHQDDLFIGAPARNINGTKPNAGIVGLRYGVKVGTFTLTPNNATVAVGQPITLTLDWTHPRNWQDLETVQLRIVGDRGIVAWLEFDESTLGIRVYDPIRHRFGRSFTPGQRGQILAGGARLDLAHSAIVTTGPQGKSVSLHFTLRFGASAAGHTFRLETLTTDHHGNSQGFDPAGTLHVGRVHVPRRR